MARIAVDAMGTDRAPAVEAQAVALALREAPADLRVMLVGDEARVRDELRRAGVGDDPRLSVRHAPQAITMDDAPAAAVRTKRDSSMRIAFDLVKAGEADAVVSAGNSGAMLACGMLVMKRLPGVERPGIVTTFPTVKQPCVLCDMGANVDVKPEVLAQFGVLGAVYAQVARGRSRPRVGLLSNGEEEHKGTELTRAAHRLLQRVAAQNGAELDYVGYVEGRDIFGGDIDVVATDGFTGNVVLKTSEGAARAVLSMLKEAFSSSFRAKLGAILARPALLALRKKIDYEEVGGAPLLGVDGIAVICHGASPPEALKNAVFAADRFVGERLRDRIAQAMARHAALWEAAVAEPATKAEEERQGA